MISPIVKTTTPSAPITMPKNRGKKVREMAGGATAECAAVCFCCPCAVLDLLVLAVYRVPAAACKKVWRRRKRRRITNNKKEQGLLVGAPEEYESQQGVGKIALGDLTVEMEMEKKEGETDAVDFDKEMRDRFYGAGFWRSPSQRETLNTKR